MEGSTQISVLILAGVCLAAIPMAAAVKALERMLSDYGTLRPLPSRRGICPRVRSNDDILPYIMPQKATRALRFLLAAGVLTLTWAAFGCLIAVLVVTI